MIGRIYPTLTVTVFLSDFSQQDKVVKSCYCTFRYKNHSCKFGIPQKALPGFPDQADHNLTILWHHTNHANFLTMILP